MTKREGFRVTNQTEAQLLGEVAVFDAESVATMPPEWQRRFLALLSEYLAAGASERFIVWEANTQEEYEAACRLCEYVTQHVELASMPVVGGQPS